MRKNIELKREKDKSTVVVQDFNCALSAIYTSNRQKISNDIVDLNNNINQLNLIDIYRILHSIIVEYTFVSISHGRIDHILGHKTHFNKFKRIELILSIFSDHSRMKLEINKKTGNLKMFTK